MLESTAEITGAAADAEEELEGEKTPKEPS